MGERAGDIDLGGGRCGATVPAGRFEALSRLFEVVGECGRVPVVDFKSARTAMERLTDAVSRGCVASIHDCSEGGLAVAAAEMAFAGDLGVNIFLSDVPFSGRDRRPDVLLFSESASRFLVEVAPARRRDFERIMKKTTCGLIGCVSEKDQMTAFGLKGEICLQAPVGLLKETWQAPLRSV